jgi:hypothetical protein
VIARPNATSARDVPQVKADLPPPSVAFATYRHYAETEELLPRSGWVPWDQVLLVNKAVHFFREQIRVNPKDRFPFLWTR